MAISIIARRGTHLIISNGARYAVIEQREDHFYNCHDEMRQGVPVNDLNAAGSIVDADDWTDRQAAEAHLEDIASRGTDLAERML